MHRPNTKDLDHLGELISKRKLKPVIDKTFTLEEIPEAFRYYSLGNFKGKIVIKMDG